MPSDEMFLLILFLAAGGLLVLLGIPLVTGRVPPNSLYGYRTQRTLNDPAAWYPANRVCGYWCLATGLVTAAAAIGAQFVGLRPPASAFVTMGALIGPLAGMILHSEIAARRASAAKVV